MEYKEMYIKMKNCKLCTYKGDGKFCHDYCDNQSKFELVSMAELNWQQTKYEKYIRGIEATKKLLQ